MQEDLIKLMNGRKGHFKLESGHHGELWLDLDSLFLRPARLQPFAQELAKLFSKHNIEAICGPMSGGAFLAEMIASQLDVELFYTERFADPQSDTLYAVKYKLPKTLVDKAKGKRIAIVDDVINAGSAIKGTYTTLEQAGADIVAIGSLLVLGTKAEDFAKEKDLALEHVSFLSNRVWEPKDCPLCATQAPLENLIS